jgi:chromosome segregation ATPase
VAQPQITSEEARQILEEIQALRQEILTLHQETHEAIRDIHQVLAEIHRVEDAEESIEQGLDDVADRIDLAMTDRQPSMDNCESCGSHVERHPAENGTLLICLACGRTSFRDQRTVPERRLRGERRQAGAAASEGPPDTIQESYDWTQKA